MHHLMSTALAPTELRGFILTRNWRDLSDGTEIEYWLATDEGPKKALLTRQTSVAFLPVRHRAAAQAQMANLQGLEVKELGLKTFDQQPVLGVYARRFRDLGKLARALQPQGIPLYEADVRPHDRYLMERFITAGVLGRVINQSQTNPYGYSLLGQPHHARSQVNSPQEVTGGLVVASGNAPVLLQACKEVLYQMPHLV